MFIPALFVFRNNENIVLIFMKIFVAGASGVIGRLLLPQPVQAGHDVIGMTRKEEQRH